jgi:HEPN domain-containing protein
MPPEDARLEDAQAWLAKADLDLRAGDLELAAPDAALWGDVAFHAQQAAEKALKALLAWHDRPFRKTHSIEELGRAGAVIVPGLTRVIDAAVPLTEYAWKFRYPGDVAEPTREEAERALALARSLVEEIRGHVPGRTPG